MIAVPNDVRSLKARVKRVISPMRLGRFAELGAMGLPKIVLDGSLSEIHLSHFTPPSLRSLLERCGYRVITDSLDPFYSATGFEKMRRAAFYMGCRAWNFLFGANIYDTILMIARKKSASPAANSAMKRSFSSTEARVPR